LEIKWLGHSAFEIITDKNLKILIDPFISNNPSSSVAVEDVSPDYVLLTHGHSDHFGDTLEIADRTGSTTIAIHEIALFVSKQGFDTISMNIGGSIVVDDIKITMLDARHSADIDFMEDVVPGGYACSFLIETEGGSKIFHAGDTGLFGDMETIIGGLYKPDIALIPIGGKFTMGPFEGALATKWISPKKVIPMHYNTFPIIEQDTFVFSNFVKQLDSNIEVIILNPGETYSD